MKELYVYSVTKNNLDPRQLWTYDLEGYEAAYGVFSKEEDAKEYAEFLISKGKDAIVQKILWQDLCLETSPG